MEQKVLRTGSLVILCALLLRVFCTIGLPDQALSPELAAWMLFFQTGRLVTPSHITFSPSTTPLIEEDPSDPTEADPAPLLPVFSPEDAAAIEVSSSFSHGADLPALISQPLDWELTGDEPKVLIVHSHGTESFAPTGEYAETTPYHTLDTQHNMISLGNYVADRLSAEGIGVVHDTVLHDTPSYNAAYNNSRKSIESYLQAHPSICLVLDLHRDSFEDEEGNQLVHTVFSEGTTLAPLMLVVGTDKNGLTHPTWQENLSLALKLQIQLENICPGICRNINLRSQRFNQDLSYRALLVEVGASGNTREEALRSAEVLVQGILSLAHGSQQIAA